MFSKQISIGLARASLLAGIVTLATVGLRLERADAADSAKYGNVVAGHAPVADAGLPQRADIGAVVTLDGSRSTDLDGDRLQYAWRLVAPAGSGATLSDPHAPRPQFTPDLPGDYLVELTVDDGRSNYSSARVLVSTGNVAPTAEAGPPRAATVGQTLALDASASTDANGDWLAYRWSVVDAPARSRVSVARARAAMATFTPDAEGEYTIELIANDGRADSAPTYLHLDTRNARPHADAGLARRAVVGTVLRLDAGASYDPENSALGYSWSLLHAPGGSNATLADRGLPQPWLRVDAPGLYIAQLIVSDGERNSDPATVVIEAVTPQAYAAGDDRRGPDTDGDGVPDAIDNCVEHANPSQIDSNGDGFGNRCDPDLDNDGFITNFGDLTILRAAFFSNPASPNWNPDADFDGNNFINFNDLSIMRDFFFGPPGPIAIVFTNPAGGNWHDPLNWNLGIVPDIRYSVRIDLDPGNVVEYSAGTSTIAGIRTSSELLLSDGTLRVDGEALFNDTFTLAGGTLADANILAGVGEVRVADGEVAGMDGVTLATGVIVGNASVLEIVDRLSFDNGSVTLASTGSSSDLRVRGAPGATTFIDGTGEIVFGASTAADTLTDIEVFDSLHGLEVGPGVTIRTGTSGGRIRHRFVNGPITVHGTIVADLAGRRVFLQGGQPFTHAGVTHVTGGAELEIDSGSWINTGTVNLTDSTLDIGNDPSDGWDNDGTIVAVNATIELDGTFTADDVGSVTGTGATILLGLLENDGQMLDIGTDLGEPTVILGNGGEIVGGTLVTTPVVLDTTFTFDGVTLAVDLLIDNSGAASVENGITLDGVTVTLASAGASTDLRFRGAAGETTTIAGSGEIVFGGTHPADTLNDIEVFDSLHNLVIPAAITVRTGTAGGRIRHRVINGAITLQGLVVSDLAGRTVTIAAAPAMLDGTLQATGGGEFALPGSWINTGTISVTDGVLDIGTTPADAWDNNGTIAVTNSTVLLDGLFTAADIGTLTGTGETIIEGVLDNTGQMLDIAVDLGGPTVTLGNGGEIVGGTIVTTPLALDTVFTFDGVTLAVDLLVDNGTASIENGITLDGATVTLASSGLSTDFRIRGAAGATTTIAGNGEIVFGGTHPADTLNDIDVFDSLHNLVIAAGITVRTGTAGGRIRHRVNNGTITIHATVVSDLPGRSVTMTAEPVTTTGAVNALAGGELLFDNNWVNTGTVSVTDGVLELGTDVNDEWDNNGTIMVDNSTVVLEGMFTAADVGTLTGTGQTVLAGVLDNTGGSLDVGADLGGPTVVFGSGGAILGGSIVTTPLSLATVFTFDAVTLSVDLLIENGGIASIDNGLTLDSVTVTLASTGGSTDLRFRGPAGMASTLAGTGEIVFAGTSLSDSLNDVEVFDSLHELVIAPAVTVRTDTAGGRIRHRVNNASITLQGSVACALADREIDLSAASFVISGTVAADAGCTVDFSSDYEIAAAGAFDVEISGTAPGEFGRFTADGDAATLDGTLNITLGGGFSPAFGDTFEIMTFDSRAGTFATENGTALGGGLFFQVNYDANNVTLEVVN